MKTSKALKKVLRKTKDREVREWITQAYLIGHKEALQYALKEISPSGAFGA